MFRANVLNTKDSANNSAVLNIAQLIKAVMSSAAEAELGALYINARKAVPQRQLLKEWATHNCPHGYKRTTAQHLVSSLATSNRNAQKQLT